MLCSALVVAWLASVSCSQDITHCSLAVHTCVQKVSCASAQYRHSPDSESSEVETLVTLGLGVATDTRSDEADLTRHYQLCSVSCRRSTSLIQCCWRAVWTKRNKAAMTIQAAVRTHLAQQHLRTRRSAACTIQVRAAAHMLHDEGSQCVCSKALLLAMAVSSCVCAGFNVMKSAIDFLLLQISACQSRAS